MGRPTNWSESTPTKCKGNKMRESNHKPLVPVLLLAAFVSTAFGTKLTHIHQIDGLKQTMIPQDGTWRCKVTPNSRGSIWAGFCYLDILYGYVESDSGQAKCGQAVFAFDTSYDFRSYATGVLGAQMKAEAWTSDEVAPPYCPPPNEN